MWFISEKACQPTCWEQWDRLNMGKSQHSLFADFHFTKSHIFHFSPLDKNVSFIQAQKILNNESEVNIAQLMTKIELWF